MGMHILVRQLIVQKVRKLLIRVRVIICFAMSDYQAFGLTGKNLTDRVLILIGKNLINKICLI